MSTIDTGHHITPSDPITARMSAGEWWKVLSLIIGTAISGAVYVTSMQGSIAEAARDAKDARADAKLALTQTTDLRADLNRALGDISGQLGYIKGQLEQLTREPRK